ncbi:triosephosphate isomerase [Nonlabens tegetincola]|uniref:Triosephosphate isomerase n=1 Tax=Nonlabens tegetincola TaxID=323273 RepID=A0A090Q2P2_9FLAO|nr:triose-phosphate isomerase [Nonlabens tegetincola]ARN70513.1 triose-phosphate isomerase [Nonlabens tegetincola]MEE2800635.1 triose-phosphate isomerase [Bacteroidota bacterium]GAK97349.1 triosephosphate isomerase [Nonlabens tegetincola]
MRKQIVAGNWKMNCDLPDTQKLITDLKTGLVKEFNCELMIAPSTPFLYNAFNSTLDSDIEVIAQNVSEQEKGAFTGETSVDMLQSIGIKTVIIGHSERRDIYGETNELIAQKVKASVNKGMRVIFCCGEHLEIRKEDKHYDLVGNQVKIALQDLTEEQMSQIVIAYEPVWAIGTGETATPEQAQEMHAHLRNELSTLFNDSIAQNTSILYGGSVKPNNAAELFAKPDVDGGLVGGASLSAESFLNIANAI